MKAALIGSQALKYRNPSILRRKPTDSDIICDEQSLEVILSVYEPYEEVSRSETNLAIKSNDSLVDFSIPGKDTSSALLLDLLKEDSNTIYFNGVMIPSLNVLFSLKYSHRFRKNDSNFWKTFFDYHSLKKIGCVIPEEYKDFVTLREKETYTHVSPKLNVSKSDFFSDDNIRYVYDHDWIHTVVSIDEAPAYTKFLSDEVKVSKSKFMSLDFDTKINSFIEEACVLAIERALANNPTLDPSKVWYYALSKILSSISSGWWREWGYENGIEIIKRYPKNFFERFREAASSNPVLYK